MDSYNVYVEAGGQQAVFCVSEGDVTNMLYAAEARLQRVCEEGTSLSRGLGNAHMRQARRIHALCSELNRIFPLIKSDPKARALNDQKVHLFQTRLTHAQRPARQVPRIRRTEASMD